jgi:hypothetical protein
LDESPGAEEIGVAEISALPGAERPTVAAAPQYISPPPRRGLLFFSPKQPGRLDPERVSGSEAIPLPPR